MGFRENLWQDTLSQVELTVPVITSPDTPTRTAIEAMRTARTGCVLICEEAKLRGIFTERDLVKRVFAPRADLDAPISRVMTPDPVTAQRTDSIGWVIRTMCRGHYRHLPVLEGEDGPPIGTVSVKRIVQYLVDHFPSAVYNLPPRPRQVQTTREGA
jgi:CBS domain-containing protein